MQETALSIVFFGDGQKEQERRLDIAKAAIVANGNYSLNAKEAWPEFYGDPDNFVPSPDADLSGFEWEQPTPETYARDLEAIMATSERITLHESEAGPLAAPPTPPAEAAEFEWS